LLLRASLFVYQTTGTVQDSQYPVAVICAGQRVDSSETAVVALALSAKAKDVSVTIIGSLFSIAVVS
jgi:hypothetical protein